MSKNQHSTNNMNVDFKNALTYRFGGSKFLSGRFIPNSTTRSSDDVVEVSILGLIRNVFDNLSCSFLVLHQSFFTAIFLMILLISGAVPLLSSDINDACLKSIE